jgi:hypothetical protein
MIPGMLEDGFRAGGNARKLHRRLPYDSLPPSPPSFYMRKSERSTVPLRPVPTLRTERPPSVHRPSRRPGLLHGPCRAHAGR